MEGWWHGWVVVRWMPDQYLSPSVFVSSLRVIYVCICVYVYMCVCARVFQFVCVHCGVWGGHVGGSVDGWVGLLCVSVWVIELWEGNKNFLVWDLLAFERQ